MTELTIDIVSDEVCPWCFTGAPFFILAGRYGVAGAQPHEVQIAALQQSLAA